LVMFREISGILQLPYLFIIQCAVSSSHTLVCSGEHQYLLLTLRSKRVPFIPRLRYYLPFASGLSHHRYHILVGRGPVIVFELAAELFNLSDFVMCLVSAQI